MNNLFCFIYYLFNLAEHIAQLVCSQREPLFSATASAGIRPIMWARGGEQRALRTQRASDWRSADEQQQQQQQAAVTAEMGSHL